MDDIHQIQAASEGVEVLADDTVEFMGDRFRMSNRVGLMPLMKFAITAKQGVNSDDLEGLAAMYALIRDCIDTTKPQVQAIDPESGLPRFDDHGQPVTEDAGPSEWDRFERHAIEQKAEADDLFGVVTAVIQRLSARPTRRPGDSSAGPQSTSGSSKAISFTPPDPHRPVVLPRRRPPEGAQDLVDVRELVGAR